MSSPTADTIQVRAGMATGSATVTSYNIDAFRTYLAQWVIVAHIAVPLLGIPLVPGRFAVWGFFVISGYLNALSFQRSLGVRSFGDAVGKYYWSRARRIYPMLAFSYLVVVLVSGQLVNADLKVLIPVGYFYNYELMNGMLWTLAIELQFYVLTPFLVLLLLRFGPQGKVLGLLCACGALNYLVPALHVLLMGDLRFIDDRTMFGNLGFYLFGMVLALFRDQVLLLWSRVSRAAVWSLALYAGIFVWFFNVLSNVWKAILLGEPLVLVASLAIICAGVRVDPGRATLYRFLGFYTYEIYVLHGLGGFLLKHLDLEGSVPAMVLLMWCIPVASAGVLHYLRGFKSGGARSGA